MVEELMSWKKRNNFKSSDLESYGPAGLACDKKFFMLDIQILDLSRNE
jgi:hypothetical protein